MQSTAEYLELLKRFKKDNAKQYGIKKLGVFGSVAREQQKEGSDVDICVETDTPNLFNLVHIKDDLQELFHCKVDVVRLRDKMDALLRERVEREGRYV
ncbi:hypothetical protein EZS27_025847 [termite gut metagenome]|uniref:Polymerase nucleotidyl transferase domain-containing protein n=1 Tax=termite gut metagenome TaxID=433724 RepID=A0A5J4QWI5_9ZZZZ